MTRLTGGGGIGDPIGVQGLPSVLPTHNPVLGAGYHGYKGE